MYVIQSKRNSLFKITEKKSRDVYNNEPFKINGNCISRA